MALAAIAFLIPTSVVLGPDLKARTKSDLQANLKRIIISENQEGVIWLQKVAGRPVRGIPEKRAEELSSKLAEMEVRDPAFFWGSYFPMVWVESVFSNLINDKNLGLRKRSVGYCGLRVDTARRYAKKLGYQMPADRAQAEMWLVNHWRANLEIGYVYLFDLYEEVGLDGLLAMSAYRTGLAGYRSGKRAITKWMMDTQLDSLFIQRVQSGHG